MLLKLKCTVNNYAWGSKGEASMAGSLARDGGHIENLDKEKPYAEVNTSILCLATALISDLMS